MCQSVLFIFSFTAKRGLLTRIYLAAQAQYRVADAGADDGAILLLVVDPLALAAFDVFARRLAPRLGQRSKGLELVAWRLAAGLVRIDVGLHHLFTCHYASQHTPECHHIPWDGCPPRLCVFSLFGLHSALMILLDEAAWGKPCQFLPRATNVSIKNSGSAYTQSWIIGVNIVSFNL